MNFIIYAALLAALLIAIVFLLTYFKALYRRWTLMAAKNNRLRKAIDKNDKVFS
jgi:hypothetical protein